MRNESTNNRCARVVKGGVINPTANSRMVTMARLSSLLVVAISTVPNVDALGMTSRR